MHSIQVFVVICSLLAIQSSAKEAEQQGTCLLQRASSMSKASSRMLQLKASSTKMLSQDAHRDWRAKQTLLLGDTNESMGVLEDFIAKQQGSGDACSARLVESKRALDGFLGDLKSLTAQVDAHEEVLETETENLNITEMSVKAVLTVYEEAMEACAKEKQDALDLVSQYESELAELVQIADPSVRYTHVTNLSEIPELFQVGSFTKERCLAFVEFVKHKANHSLQSTQHEPKDCDTQREELQEAFTEAVISIRDLVKQAQEDSEDKTCVETAEAKKAAGLVPLIAERDRAASMIETATESLAALEPVLDLVDDRAEKMSHHIYNVLTPECAEAKEVSEVLQKIRNLILLLEECPGRNDFKLKIPEEDVDETEAAELDVP